MLRFRPADAAARGRCLLTRRTSTCKPRSCVYRGACNARMDEGDAEVFSLDAMQTLSLRIAKIKVTTDASDRVSRACSSIDIEEVLRRRPDLPVNVTAWDELKADHHLIVDWHEKQWASLGETVEEW